jgi:hypothetical protein
VNFGETLDRVGTVLAAGNWQWAVAGGVALSAYGNPRMTLALDVVTEAAAQDTARQLFASLRSLPGPQGQSVSVPRAEHLIAMKVQAMKNAPDRAPQDLADIAYLLSLPGTDLAEARGYFVKADMSDRWEQLTHGR